MGFLFEDELLDFGTDLLIKKSVWKNLSPEQRRNVIRWQNLNTPIQTLHAQSEEHPQPPNITSSPEEPEET